jgi:hypothetical protein
MENDMPIPARATLAALVALALAVSPGTLAQDLAPSRLAGHWTGVGRFYDVELKKRLGPLPFDLVISPDLTLSGTAGGATIQPSKGERHGKQVDFKALLSGELRPGTDLKKDHLVLLVTRVDDAEASADFHLKSNFTFDFTMRPGAVELKRTR